MDCQHCTFMYMYCVCIESRKLLTENLIIAAMIAKKVSASKEHLCHFFTFSLVDLVLHVHVHVCTCIYNVCTFVDIYIYNIGVHKHVD